MKRFSIIPLSVAMLVASAELMAAAEPNLLDLTRQLAAEKPAPQRTPEQLDAVYLKVIAALIPDMASDDAGKRGNAQTTLERIAFNASRPGSEADRAACSKAIGATITADLPSLTTAWMIRQLERIGRDEAVPYLVKLLDAKDTQIRDCARRALLKNSATEAGDALRKALPSSDSPAWRIAIINALASRREPATLSTLLTEAASDNDDVRIAAMSGLAKIGDKAAAQILAAAMNKGSPAAKRAATDSYLLLADTLADKGDNAAALGIYSAILPSQGYLKCAAVIGIGRAGSASNLPVIFEAIATADPKLHAASVDALVLLKGQDVTAAIADRARNADTHAKPALLRALARRGDKSTLPLFLAAADDADEPTRIEAIRGLGSLGDAATVPLLLKIAATTGNPQETARESLQRLDGDTVDKAILAAMNENESKIRLEVIRALAARRVAAATATLLESAQHADPGVRSESLKALGGIAAIDALAPVAALILNAQDDAARANAADAIARIAGREADLEKRAQPILATLQSSTGPARLSLLRVLGRIGGNNSLLAVRAALLDNDPAVKDAAIRSLADWPDAAPADDLLAIAKNATDQTHRVLAIRGFVRVVRQQSGRPSAQTASMLADALQAANRPDEKKQIIGALAEVRHVLALDALLPCLTDTNLAAEAANAAVRVARDIVNDQPEKVKAAMAKVLAVANNADLRKQAQETLDRAELRLKQAGQIK